MKSCKKMGRKKSRPRRPVFGSSAPRFGIVTFHPNLDPSGLFTVRDRGCDPAYYDVTKTMKQVFKAKALLSTWNYKQFVEDWSKNLGYRNQAILNERRWRLTTGGPAWCQPYVPTRYEPACKNMGFGRDPRFKPSKNYLPGPGTYYNAKTFKSTIGPHSTRPPFEREEPCRMKDTTPKWSLPPDRYTILDKESIEQKLHKVVSQRGPYDLFTGKRDGTTIKNHFSDSLKCYSKTWPLALPGSLEKYKKSLFGTMNKTGREQRYRGRNSLVDPAMAYHPPSDPGPAHLNIDKPKKFVENCRGFNSSYDKEPGYQRTVVWPGVGRYRTPPSRPPPGHGHGHMFRGHDSRTIGAYLPEPFNSF